MIIFEKRSLLDSILRAVFPAIRRRQDAELMDSMKILMENPDMPCVVEGAYIPNGFGN